ncbi:hypothetical protein AC249_AIPGENE27894 [Exaiptasia diaphana]|nr:hypothetical protein AC249_AIPGENE27894 [Exaiptasia diaphana]
MVTSDAPTSSCGPAGSDVLMEKADASAFKKRGGFWRGWDLNEECCNEWPCSQEEMNEGRAKALTPQEVNVYYFLG